jgi:hypothetical protein
MSQKLSHDAVLLNLNGGKSGEQPDSQELPEAVGLRLR